MCISVLFISFTIYLCFIYLTYYMFVFYLLYFQWRKKKFKLIKVFFSRVNEVKTYGLEQQLFLRMLRNLILQFAAHFGWMEIALKATRQWHLFS